MISSKPSMQVKMYNRGNLLIILLVVLVNTGIVAQPEMPKAGQLYQAGDLTDAVFTTGIEGPAVDSRGFLYVVNYQEQGTIGMVEGNGSASLWVRLPEGSIGNGIRFGSNGAMYVADYTGHNVLVVDMASRQVSVLAHEPAMAQPNDLAIMGNDIIFASDPDWKNNSGSIWSIDQAGKVTLLEKNMGTTNGIEVAPGDDRLYVNESVQRKIWVYDLDPSGAIRNKKLFHSFDDFGMDGMRCDIQGNLFVTRHGKGTVAVISPDGEMIREIRVRGTKPSNIAFGGPDGRTCYVTLQDRKMVETFRVASPGREWILNKRGRP